MGFESAIARYRRDCLRRVVALVGVASQSSNLGEEVGVCGGAVLVCAENEVVNGRGQAEGRSLIGRLLTVTPSRNARIKLPP